LANFRVLETEDNTIVGNTPNYRLLLILLLALLLRLLLWSQPLHQPANDEIEYIAVARDLLAGRGWQFYEHFHWLRAPLYPLFLAGSLWLAGGDLHRAALPNITLSVANVYLIYRLALALADRRAAYLAALLVTVLLTFATFGSLYMSETLFTFLFTAALVCLVRPPTTDHRPPTTDHRPPTTAENPHLVTLSPCHLVKEHWSLAAAGVLFGLATLTRSITLLFLPVVAIWLLFRLRTTDHRPPTTDHRPPTIEPPIPDPRSPIPDTRSRRRILVPLVFLLCAVLTIAPWTVRNYLAYGRLIPVETGLSFNLWFFSDPHESNDEIYHTLRSIPNPAVRADYATAKGLARLREDPGILLRNLWPNWVRLLEADTIEDRFIQESYYSDVNLPLFTTALIFDDALYVLILLAAGAGLVLRWPGRRLAALGDSWWLVVAWVLYVIATVLLTHGEARYRHFLHPVLIPYAAWMLGHTKRHEGIRKRSIPSRGFAWLRGSGFLTRALVPQLLIVGLLWAVILGVALRAYPWRWAKENLARGWHVLRGDIDLSIGDLAAALRAYERATAAHQTPDGWLRRGDAARALGDQTTALRAYRNAVHLTPPYIAASARLGDLLREIGDTHGAREAFEGQYADQQQVVDWAWRHLRPPPASALDIGDGLDFGYIGGVYPAETLAGETARWTSGHATLRLGTAPRGQAGAGTVLVRLLLAAPRPDGAAVRGQVCAASRCWPLEVGPVWRFYTLPFAATPGAPLDVEIVSETFRPSDQSPASADDRTLGVVIGRATIVELKVEN
jgi:tetratricopeptide (TPR) repeat protein